MYKNLGETEGAVYKHRVYLVKEVLTKMKKKMVENVPKDKEFKIKENEKIVDIVERILEFNNKIQSRRGLKILKKY